MRLRRLEPDDWECWRDMRLAALSDSPDAFASSLVEERNYTEARWRDWIRPAYQLQVVVEDGAGMVGAWKAEDQPAVELYSMWVRPGWRGRGIGDLLVGEVLDWAAGEGHQRVDLWVAEGNVAAERLYRRHGFQMTDERQPHPGYPGVFERAMTLRLGAARTG
jgi:GNAT superfamily N-acetyltransferase